MNECNNDKPRPDNTVSEIPICLATKTRAYPPDGVGRRFQKKKLVTRTNESMPTTPKLDERKLGSGIDERRRASTPA